MKTTICVLILLFVTPVITVTCLSYFDPEHWGGGPTLSNIIVMAIFGVLSVPMWLTYIPTILLTPLSMKTIAKNDNYYTISIWKLIFFTGLAGAAIGIFIMSPMILRSLPCPFDQFINGVRAGAISGAISYILIGMLFRLCGSTGSRKHGVGS